MPLPKSIMTARMYLATDYPYVGALLWALRPKETPGLGTMGVDHNWNLYYDPKIDEKWTEAEVVGVLFHEINHILRNHLSTGRAAPFMHCRPFNNKCSKCCEAALRFNICGDLEINPGLLKLGFQLPVEGQFPSKYGLPDGLLAEEYWHKLPENPNQGQTGAGEKGCGSCAGNPGEHEPANGQGDDGDDDGFAASERELIIRDVAKKIEEAAKNRGNVPLGLDRWAHDYLNPKVSWRKELRAVAHRHFNECMGKREYSFKRMHRRQMVSEVILPTIRDFVIRIGVIRDTSGSMGEKDLARTLAETRGILKEMQGELIDIEVDCQVHGTKTIRNIKDVKMQGGGGTDMGVGINHAATLRPKIDVVVVLTDGETPWPASPPPFPCIVVLTQQGSRKNAPSWCKVIQVND